MAFGAFHSTLPLAGLPNRLRYAALAVVLLSLQSCGSASGARSTRAQIPDLDNIEYVYLEDFAHVPQTQSNWCWAAVLAGVINSQNLTDYSACEIAARAFGANCCGNPAACNAPHSLYAFAEILRPSGLIPEVIEGRIGFDSVRRELRAGKPLLIRVESPLGSGHFVLLVGYDVSHDNTNGRVRRSVVVSDPMYGYFVGRPDDIGYDVSWEDLNAGRLLDYNARWTHTVTFDDRR